MKDKKLLLVACGVIIGVVLLCCCLFFAVAYAAGISSYSELKNEFETAADDLDELEEELSDIQTEIEGEEDPGDDGEQDPNAGDGTELVILEDGLEYQIYSPKPNGLISSPLTVTGQISGTWYFEGSFQIELRDYDGNVLATGIALAQSDWMTSNLVEYEGTLIFVAPVDKTYAELYLLKDNPSGLPENKDQISYLVRFE